MNEYSYQGFDVIVNFRFMMPEELNELRLALSLPIGVPELLYCRNYYRDVEKRDLTVSELLTISALIMNFKIKPESIVLSGIKATDANTGMAFDDLLKKLDGLKKKAPYNFFDIASAADCYLKRAGKKTATPGIYGKCADLGPLEFSAKGCKPIASLAFPEKESSCTLGLPLFAPFSHEKATENDSFIALSPLCDTADDFADSVRKFLAMPGALEGIKFASTLESGGALPFILDNSRGFYADLTNFPGSEATPSPTLLTETRDNVIIALVDGKSILHLSMNAEALGLRFCAFARPINLPKSTVRCPGMVSAVFNADFLRVLRFATSLYATASGAERKSKSASFTINGTPALPETAYLSSNVLYSAATTENGSPKDTVNTILAAISPLVAAGADFEEISVSFDTRLPLSSFLESDAEQALALLMGQYRIQAELCLLSEGSRYLCTRDELSLSCYARTSLPQKAVSPRITKEEGDLYILAPRTADDGFVRFDELRSLYKLINSLVRSGKATAVRAVNRSGFQKALTDMTGSAMLSEFSLPDELSKDPIGAFIVESNENLAGLKIHYTKNTPNTF